MIPELDLEFDLVESKQDYENFKNFIKKGYSALSGFNNIAGLNLFDPEEKASEWLDRFLNAKKYLKAPENDLYYWIKKGSVSALIERIEEVEDNAKFKKDKQELASKGAVLVGENDIYRVYHITTYEASAKYGANTKWCISGKDLEGEDTYGNYHWKEHKAQNAEFYFYLPKSGNTNYEKYALAIYPDHFEIFDSADVKQPYIPDAPKIKGLPDVGKHDTEADDLEEISIAGKFSIGQIRDIKEYIDSDLAEDYELNTIVKVTLTDNSERYFATTIDEPLAWFEIDIQCDPFSGRYLKQLYNKHNGMIDYMITDLECYIAEIDDWTKDPYKYLEEIVCAVVDDIKNNRPLKDNYSNILI